VRGLSDKLPSVPGYQIGYRRPPEQHRFKKGVSGNPGGRPAKAQRASPPNPAYAELDDILLKEALRPITVRENDELIEMPMIQAVLRSLGVAAVKGHHRSQLALTTMVKSVQSARFEDRRALFVKALDYKDSWKEAFAEADRCGAARPEPVPHPDDMTIDFDNMAVKFNGPSTEDEKAHWNMMLKRKADALEDIAEYRQLLKRRSRYSHFYEEEIAREQKLVEMISLVIPDEKTRRRPGFDINEWRQSQPGYAEFMAKARKAQGQRQRRRALG